MNMKSSPPTQLSKKGDVFSSRAKGQDAYREAAIAAPPSEEGAANNQVFEDMPNRFTGPKEEPSACYMCDEVIPQKRDTIALQPVSCDACCAYHLRCAKLTGHGQIWAPCLSPHALWHTPQADWAQGWGSEGLMVCPLPDTWGFVVGVTREGGGGWGTGPSVGWQGSLSSSTRVPRHGSWICESCTMNP